MLPIPEGFFKPGKPLQLIQLCSPVSPLHELQAFEGCGGCLEPFLRDGDLLYMDQRLPHASGCLVRVRGPFPLGVTVKRLLCVLDELDRETWVLAAKEGLPMMIFDERSMSIEGVIVAAVRQEGRSSGIGEQLDADTAEAAADVRSNTCSARK